MINSKADRILVEFVDVLLENEAEGGRVAYCLSDARMTNGLNGLSFGFIQHDLASNPGSKKILVDILQRTANGNPNSGLAKDDIAAVDRGVLSVRAPELRLSKDLSLRDVIQRVDTTLSTSKVAGVEIDADFTETVSRAVETLQSEIKSIPDTVGAVTYLKSDRLGQLIVLDYENFLGALGPQFKGYLAGEPQKLSKMQIQIKRPASFTDIMRFYLTTRQGEGGASDQRAEVLRRLNTIVKVYQKDESVIRVSRRDKIFLTKELQPMLTNKSNPYIAIKKRYHLYDNLLILIKSAT